MFRIYSMIFKTLVLVCTCRQMLYVKGRDIFYNNLKLNWESAVFSCWSLGGTFVPYDIGDGRNMDAIDLTANISLWTADYSSWTSYRIHGDFDCGYVTISSTGNKTWEHDDCSGSKPYLCCNILRCINHPADTWYNAIQTCRHFNNYLWDGTYYHEAGSYWVDYRRWFKYHVLAKADGFPTRLRSCGVYDDNRGLEYDVSCDKSYKQSLCELEEAVPPYFTRSCFRSSDVTSSSARQTTVTPTPVVHPLPTSEPSTSQPTHTVTAVYTTDSSSAHSSSREEGYGMKIGLPVAAVVLILTLVFVVVYWKRRHSHFVNQAKEEAFKTGTVISGRRTSSYSVADSNETPGFACFHVTFAKHTSTSMGSGDDHSNTTRSNATVHLGVTKNSNQYAQIDDDDMVNTNLYGNDRVNTNIHENDKGNTNLHGNDWVYTNLHGNSTTVRQESEHLYDNKLKIDGDDKDDNSTKVRFQNNSLGLGNIYCHTFEVEDNVYDSTKSYFKNRSPRTNNVYDMAFKKHSKDAVYDSTINKVNNNATGTDNIYDNAFQLEESCHVYSLTNSHLDSKALVTDNAYDKAF